MYRMGLVLMAAGLLAACAAGGYMPANANGYGFSDRKLSTHGYEVTYVGEDGLNQQQVDDFALLRAAELGAAQGYAYLNVVSSRDGEGDLAGWRTIVDSMASPRTSGQTQSTFVNGAVRVRACTLVVIYSAAPEPGLGEPSQAIPPLVVKLRTQYGLPGTVH
jgi:hypothetical protein